MFRPANLMLFPTAALIVAITPGPGISYVAARTLAGGRSEGLASNLGTGLGGLVHVIAGAAGLSALVMASTQAFDLLKFDCDCSKFLLRSTSCRLSEALRASSATAQSEASDP